MTPVHGSLPPPLTPTRKGQGKLKRGAENPFLLVGRG